MAYINPQDGMSKQYINTIKHIDSGKAKAALMCAMMCVRFYYLLHPEERE